MAEQGPSLEELNAQLAPPQPLFTIVMQPTAQFQPPSSAEGRDMLRQHLGMPDLRPGCGYRRRPSPRR